MQEIGRGGRDGKSTIALTLVSEPTGFFNPDDKLQFQGLINKLSRQYQQAEKLAFQLPIKGDIQAVKNVHSDKLITRNRTDYISEYSAPIPIPMLKKSWITPRPLPLKISN